MSQSTLYLGIKILSYIPPLFIHSVNLQHSSRITLWLCLCVLSFCCSDHVILEIPALPVMPGNDVTSQFRSRHATYRVGSRSPPRNSPAVMSKSLTKVSTAAMLWSSIAGEDAFDFCSPKCLFLLKCCGYTVQVETTTDSQVCVWLC